MPMTSRHAQLEQPAATNAAGSLRIALPSINSLSAQTRATT